MNVQIMRMAAISFFGIALIAAPASAIERFVDCDKGQSIQKELDTAPTATGDRF